MLKRQIKSFIPSIISDFFPDNNCLYEEDILPYAPLLDQPSLWEGEIKKHDENCVWWRTGTIEMSSPIDEDTFLELHELREKKARKHEAFHFFGQWPITRSYGKGDFTGDIL